MRMAWPERFNWGQLAVRKPHWTQCTHSDLQAPHHYEADFKSETLQAPPLPKCPRQVGD